MIYNYTQKSYTLKHIIITKSTVEDLQSFFADLHKELEEKYKESTIGMLCEIRYQDTMYSGNSSEEFLKQFKQNYEPELIKLDLMVVDKSGDQDKTIVNATLNIDLTSQLNKFFVYGLDQSEVTGIQNRFIENIKKAPTRHKFIRSKFIEIMTQLIAVIFMTSLAVLLTNIVEDKTNLSIKYSSVYIFIVFFLLFSNLWTYIAQGLIFIRNKFYPEVDIREKPRRRIILSAFLFLLSAIGLWSINQLLTLLFNWKLLPFITGS